MEYDEKFDLQIVYDNFTSSLHEEDDIILKPYLDSYEELNKFFYSIGTIFGFVSEDLKSKMDILYNLLTNNNFTTVKSMMEYEKSNELLYKEGYTSGSRTLLRLHRGLDFIQAFLKSVAELKDEDYTGPVCREVYDQTLAKHHSFLVKTGARIAMFTLPNREQLFKKVCGSDEKIVKTLELLPQMLKTTSLVYMRIEELFTIHNLHELP